MELHFCKECNNILYPKEDRDQQVLYLTCRNCEHFEEATSNLIAHIKLSQQAKGSTMSSHSRDLATDKTLPRTNLKKCPGCGQNNA
ncbi:hypothetical protein COBT_003851, partial [Conglomerata obtusa]